MGMLTEYSNLFFHLRTTYISLVKQLLLFGLIDINNLPELGIIWISRVLRSLFSMNIVHLA